MKAIIPPPLVLLLCGALMWLIARFLPAFSFVVPHSGLTFGIIAITGFLVLTSGVFHILKRKTVIHPDRKSLMKARILVTTGIFRYTRNPIYLGMAIMLLAWMIFLGSWLSITGLFMLFMAFITKYQILPEEEALENIFGEEYKRYKRKVRRWL